MDVFSCVSSFLTRKIVIAFRVHPTLKWLHPKLVTFAKTLFPDKVTFTGTRNEDLDISLGDTIQFITLPILRSVTLSHLQNPFGPSKETFTGSQVYDLDIFWGPLFSVPERLLSGCWKSGRVLFFSLIHWLETMNGLWIDGHHQRLRERPGTDSPSYPPEGSNPMEGIGRESRSPSQEFGVVQKAPEAHQHEEESPYTEGSSCPITAGFLPGLKSWGGATWCFLAFLCDHRCHGLWRASRMPPCHHPRVLRASRGRGCRDGGTRRETEIPENQERNISFADPAQWDLRSHSLLGTVPEIC